MSPTEVCPDLRASSQLRDWPRANHKFVFANLLHLGRSSTHFQFVAAWCWLLIPPFLVAIDFAVSPLSLGQAQRPLSLNAFAAKCCHFKAATDIRLGCGLGFESFVSKRCFMDRDVIQLRLHG